MSFLVLYAFQWPIHRKTSRSHGAPNWTQVIGKSPGAFHSTTNPTILRFPALWKVSRQNCNSISTITSEIKWYLMWDIWYMTLWHMIFDMRYRSYMWYMMISVLLLFGYYFTHALKYSIPFSARTLASMPHALGDGESLTFAESMGGLTTNPVFISQDLVNPSVVFDSKYMLFIIIR